ncbi:hypothetical protein FBU30_007503 [Linnemannia zychae]|nr:hypothetical protein FBU30_007503 [Linnemannia zychae]
MATPMNEDVLVILSHSHTNTKAHSVFVDIGSKRWVRVTSFINKGTLEITSAGLTERRPFEKFRYLSILDDQNVILSLNQISEKTHSVTTIIPKDRVLKVEGFVFKILFTASSTATDPKPRTTYLKASSAHIAPPLTEKDVTMNSSHSDYSHSSLSEHLLKENTSMSKSNVTKDQNELAETGPSYCTFEMTHGNYSHSRSSDFEISRLPNIVTVEIPPDIHFYHCEQGGVPHIFKAHQANLSKCPELLQYVNTCRTAKDKIMSHMTTLAHCTLQTPLIVDVSFFPLQVFKNLIENAYSQSTMAQNNSNLGMVSDDLHTLDHKNIKVKVEQKDIQN